MLPKIPFADTASFKKLKVQAARMKNRFMRELFDEDPERFNKFTVCFENILLDYSKNKIDDEVMDTLAQLDESMLLMDILCNQITEEECRVLNGLLDKIRGY